MPRDSRAFLWDVLEAGKAIQAFTQGFDAPRFAGDALVHSAVERKFEVIGEALSQLAKLSPELAASVPGLAQIVAFRNQLIHGYAKVNHSTVWVAVQDSLPLLLTQVALLFSELGEAGDARHRSKP
jgi:uncharacterized protein with HEPN domain